MRPIDARLTTPGIETPRAAAGRHARHALSRRAFLGGAGATGGAVLGAGFLGPLDARAARTVNASPKPTAQTMNLGGLDFAITFFGPGMDPSTIADFNGFVGVAEVQGSGIATNADGSTETLLFDTDMRFMSGVYVAQDGTAHKGALTFV